MPTKYAAALSSGTTTATIEKAAQALDVPAVMALAICEAGPVTFAKMPGMDAKVEAKKRIAAAFETYAGADISLEENDKPLQACARIAAGQYRMFTPKDITTAFELAAAGKLPVNITCYGGRIQATVFGQLLLEYKNYRAKVLQAVEKASQAAQEAAQAAKRATISEDYVRKALAAYKAGKCEWRMWTDVPLGLYEALEAHGLLEKNGPLWVEVKKQVVSAFVSGADYTPGFSDILVGDSISCRNLRREMRKDPDVFPAQLTPRAIAWYKKRAVFYGYKQLHEK